MDAAAPEIRRPASRRVVVALAALVVAAYGNALLWGQFQFDDFNVIVDNPRVHSWQAWFDELGHGIRPLLKLSYTLDWMAGWGAAGFHVTNIAIHLANAVLIWLLARRLAEAMPRLREHSATISLLTAMLFALHPIHSEAVTYVCGRSSSLMSLFYLAGLLAHAGGGRLRQQVLAPACFVLALCVKETAVTFPLALLAWDLACGKEWKTALRGEWTSWAVLFGATGFFLSDDSYLAHIETSATLNSLAGNVATQGMALAWLLRQWALPLWLDIDPDLPLLTDLAAGWPGLVLIAAIVLLAISFRHGRPWMAFALGWLIIHFLLHLVLPRLDVVNERQMYLAGWPLALVLATEMTLLLDGRRRALAALAIALACTAGSLTILRNRDYRSEIALWEATAAESPDKARVRNNLGHAYQLAGRDDEARREYLLALQLDPGYFKARGNLARLGATVPRN